MKSKTAIGLPFRLGFALVLCVVVPRKVEAAVTCQFDQDFCGWTPTPRGIWQTTTQTLSPSVKPPSGSIGMALASSPTDGWADLTSEEIASLPFTTLFSFKVMQQMFALSNNNPYILVYIVPTDGSEEVLIYSKRDQFTWSENIVLTLQPRNRFRIRFRLRTGNGKVYAAVAGIVLNREGLIILPTTPTDPPTTTLQSSSLDRLVSCTFRSGMCAWQNSEDCGQLQWNLEHGMSIGLGLPGAPEASSDDSFAMARGVASQADVVTACLQSPSFQSSDPSELSFWYNIGSYDFTSHQTKLRMVAGTETLGLTSTGDLWEQAHVTIPASAEQLRFAADLEGNDYVAIDEVLWNGDENGSPVVFPTTSDIVPSAAPTTTAGPTTPMVLPDNLLSCDFADDLCGWTTETDEDFQWNRTNLIQAAPRPISGVASTDGVFLFAQGNMKTVAERAHLVSSPITLRQRAILRFYVFNTAPMGDGVYVTLNFADGQQTTIMRDIVNGFNRWIVKNVVLDILDREFSIVIGAGVMSIRRFGLDQIALLPEGDVEYGSQPIRLTTTPRTTTPRTTTTPRPAVTDEHVTCSFNFDTCGWRTHPSSEGHWNRTEDAGVANLPATASHQVADAWFVAFRGSSASDLTQGLLESQQFDNRRPRNLTFWYYKRGTGSGVSYLGLRVADATGQQGINIWRHQGSPNPTWQQTTLTITDTGKISLVFYCGATNYIVCGVDEIYLDGEDELDISAFPDD
ncbi:MAM and LDL-receptor class A domain-containing protein 1-like [Paramacrobiotus metropolitanus]|uniref:MAM and LDL-receptor class A domain-containing protein 1-like n=1 Tax=Paramacrobiotus metropolitanus TaxID=2943436 RepID=UPI002445E66C|nr:MAM and LDL-receptor class A domain-containing protein 1-like [Paramacrobiotus metropolitanus]